MTDIFCRTCGQSPKPGAPRKLGEWDDAGHIDGAHYPDWSRVSFEGSEWEAAPSDALWSGFVVCGHPREGTDYFYGYADSEEAPDVELLVPEGWELLSSKIKATQNNPAYAGPEEE